MRLLRTRQPLSEPRFFTVSELKPGNTTGVLTLSTEVKNQKNEVVMDGFQRYLLRKRPAQ